MNQHTPKDNRGFVEHWRRAGAMLERVRRRELREFDHRAAAEAIDALLQMGVDFGEERSTSGLVELQRRLHRGPS